MKPEGYREWATRIVLDGEPQELEDPVVVEEPLEIRIATETAPPLSLAIVMRTPGDDEDLAAGFVYAEGIAPRPGDVADVEVGSDPDRPRERRVDVRLSPGLRLDPDLTVRGFMASSACGVCGSAALDAALAAPRPELPAGPPIDLDLLGRLPAAMRERQVLFGKTGGIHAAALFDARGELLVLREDVGRHNAVDKVVGALLREGRVPPGPSILVVSGRLAFEIVHKAARAGIPVVVAVGAPTTLALDLAHRTGMTVVGFARPKRLNVYTGRDRIPGS